MIISNDLEDAAEKAVAVAEIYSQAIKVRVVVNRIAFPFCPSSVTYERVRAPQDLSSACVTTANESGTNAVRELARDVLLRAEEPCLWTPPLSLYFFVEEAVYDSF